MMDAVTNIELYEALKRNLNEDAARMIAEVVPPARDLLTRADLGGIEGRLGGLEGRLGGVEREVVGLKGYIDSRLLRYTLAFFVPMWATMAGLIVAVIAKV